MQQKNKTFFTVAGMVLVTVFLSGILVGKDLRLALSAEIETYEELRIFAEVLSLIQKNYVESTVNKDLVYGAIRGMLNTLDPHSAFMSPDMYKEIQIDTKGEFGGLGIQIGIRDNRLTVIAPIEDTPAARAGILAGDAITRVDDVSTKDMSLMDAVHKMRGRKGTQVTLTVVRKGVEEPLIFELTRETIRIDSVKSEVLEGDIGYIRLTQFQERSGRDMSKAMKKVMEEGATSLILDLRNNPGGLLNAAIDVTELFIPSDKTVVSVKGRGPEGDSDDYLSKRNNPYDGFNMIVLVNGGSASASEIVAGALQDYDRAVVLGTQTFGKGSVQTILQLTDGSGLRLTTAKYYTPSGRSIQNIGITPDIIVEASPSSDGDRVPVIREADLEGHLGNETLSEGDSPKASPAPGPLVMIPDNQSEDPQLQKAMELLKSVEIFEKSQSLRKGG